MFEVFAFLLMVSAALGGGAWMLRLTRVLGGYRLADQLGMSFTLGIGIIGVGVFFLALTGQIAVWQLMGLLLVLSGGIGFLIPFVRKASFDQPLRNPNGSSGRSSRAITWAFIGGLFLIGFYDFLEALAPPTDGDSLAYHFALPKAFFESGGLFPIYRSTEGTIPLLQQMTYLAAYGIGGELAMTLWTMASGWAATMLVFLCAKKFVGLNGSLAITLVFLTTPAVVYGAGSGQVEVRNAAFVLLAAAFAVEARKTKLLRYALLAGIAAGFFAASKYTGLILGFAVGLAMLAQRNWLRPCLIYCVGMIVAGGQWYGWNAWITGDPIFPLLYGKIDYLPHVPWNEAIHQINRSVLREQPIPPDVLGFFLYPIKSTLFAHQSIEALRVGFGPIVFMQLPIAGMALWVYRARLLAHPLFVFGSICLVSYAIWFFFGPSQRVRHLLPVYPLLLLCVSIATLKMTRADPRLKPIVASIFMLVVPLQLSGATLYAVNFFKFAFSDEGREAFLTRVVSGYAIVAAVNAHLTVNDRFLAIKARQLIYHFNVPVFYANPFHQTEIATHQDAKDPMKLWRQLRAQNISHLVMASRDKAKMTNSGHRSPPRATGQLRDLQCLKAVDTIMASHMVSRTVPKMGAWKVEYSLMALTPNTCRLR